MKVEAPKQEQETANHVPDTSKMIEKPTKSQFAKNAKNAKNEQLAKSEKLTKEEKMEHAIQKVSRETGVMAKDLYAIWKNENGGLLKQANGNLWSVYSKQKADSLSAWCNINKRK